MGVGQSRAGLIYNAGRYDDRPLGIWAAPNSATRQAYTTPRPLAIEPPDAVMFALWSALGVILVDLLTSRGGPSVIGAASTRPKLMERGAGSATQILRANAAVRNDLNRGAQAVTLAASNSLDSIRSSGLYRLTPKNLRSMCVETCSSMAGWVADDGPVIDVQDDGTNVGERDWPRPRKLHKDLGLLDVERGILPKVFAKLARA
ncbi:hypothetical protein B0T24DRAFT_701758 [Lasiosphaeria ovina]|uniref:Uncharacterized protein n=1 Tax=Lasiosphaeria ovina TaxID=92902 RepID=A0AAE0KIV4_9PEZI|nr:hypothetical protein B0T24DRAFT_701758 [Lasiosphaeria ovina]